MQKIYCDGAAMAYRDCAKKIRNMITNSPKTIRSLVYLFEPIAEYCELKANLVYKECEQYIGQKQ